MTAMNGSIGRTMSTILIFASPVTMKHADPSGGVTSSTHWCGIRRQIMCYVHGVAVLISVDVFRRLMGYLKPIQALFVFRVVSTRVINAAA
jgi:hypothetical protein